MKKIFQVYKVLLVLFFLILPAKTWTQILPKENSKLNYRIIGFSFPLMSGASNYKIEISTCLCNTEESFQKHIIVSFSGDSNKIIGEVPEFGKEYTWRYIGMNAAQTKSNFYHFSTSFGPEVDTNVTRLRIMKPAEKHQDAYIFSQNTRTLYDMNGKPVWYIPELTEMPVGNDIIYGDFKITKQGTITFGRIGKDYEQEYEMNYDGDILWRSPKTVKLSRASLEDKHEEFVRNSNGDYMSCCYPADNCHREFMRLATGNYMVLSSEFMWIKLPIVNTRKFMRSHEKDESIRQDDNKEVYERVEFGNLIEYDAKANVVWSWNSSKYFIGSDVFHYRTQDSVFDMDQVHENAFYFDEKSNEVYISFKHISRIIKIQYPSGKILRVYGKIDEQNAPGYFNGLFFHQHNCGLTQEGYLSMFNNNDVYTGSLPSLLLMQEPVSENGTLRKVWEYECTTEGRDTTGKVPNFGAAGNFTELPDSSFLACMTSVEYTKIFIINRDKKILWSAFPERWNPVAQKWKAIIEYRASAILNKKELERLIWNTGK